MNRLQRIEQMIEQEINPIKRKEMREVLLGVNKKLISLDKRKVTSR